VLGIDVGAPPDEARRAFARAGRRLRRAGGDLDQRALEDLTWALHQVEQIHTDPEADVGLLRVPADRAVLAPGGPGLLDPAPPRLERRTPPTTAADDAALALAALVELATSTLGARSEAIRCGSPYTVVPPAGVAPAGVPPTGVPHAVVPPAGVPPAGVPHPGAGSR
jgi:hypothetical protein